MMHMIPPAAGCPLDFDLVRSLHEWKRDFNHGQQLDKKQFEELHKSLLNLELDGSMIFVDSGDMVSVLTSIFQNWYSTMVPENANETVVASVRSAIKRFRLSLYSENPSIQEVLHAQCVTKRQIQSMLSPYHLTLETYLGPSLSSSFSLDHLPLPRNMMDLDEYASTLKKCEKELQDAELALSKKKEQLEQKVGNLTPYQEAVERSRLIKARDAKWRKLRAHCFETRPMHAVEFRQTMAALLRRDLELQTLLQKLKINYQYTHQY